MSDTPKTPVTAHAQPQPPQGLCPECGQSYPIRRGRRFCSTPCQVAFNHRMAREGRIMAPLVKAMFATRGGGHGGTLPICGIARSELTRIARMLNDADRAAARPPVTSYVQGMFDSGTLYMDRRRLPDPPVTSGPIHTRPLERIEVPGGPFLTEDDAIDRGWEPMKQHCRDAGYPLPGRAAPNPDKDRPGTFKLNGMYVTDGNNRRKRRSHALVVRGI